MDQKIESKMVSEAITDILFSESAEETIDNIHTGDGPIFLFGKEFSPEEAQEMIINMATTMKSLINKTSIIMQAEFHCALADCTNEIDNETSILGRHWMN